MFAPGGIAGLLMMHRPLIRAGTLGVVIPSYLLALVPTLVLACGAILGIETVAHYTESQGEGNVIDLLAIPFNATARSTWIMAGVMIIGGFLIARLTWQRIAEAWDRATTGARDRGYLA